MPDRRENWGKIMFFFNLFLEKNQNRDLKYFSMVKIADRILNIGFGQLSSRV